MEIIGRQINFGVAVEAVRGTPEATATKWFRKVIANIVPRAERVIDDSGFGRLEDADRVRTVRKWNEGSLEGPLHADAIGYLFYNLYGDVESTPVASGVVSHEFSLEQSIQHPTLTLFVQDGPESGSVRDDKMGLGVIKSLEVTVATDDYVRFKAEFLGALEAAGGSTPAQEAEFDFVSRDVTLKFADTEGGLAAADAVKAKDLTISWAPNVISDYVIGNYSPDDIYNGAFSIEFNFSKNFDDQTFENLYRGDDFKYCQITIEGEAELADASSHPKIVLLLNKVQLTDWNRSGGPNELVKEEITCKAFYNTTDEQQSLLTLVNETATYAAGS